MAPGPNKDGIITSFKPNQQDDYPYFVQLSLIGNDVCNKSPEVSSMTPVDKYRESTIESLRYLDTVLPPGSRVLMSGLVDGSILYDVMEKVTHPIGVSFPQFYEYLGMFPFSSKLLRVGVQVSFYQTSLLSATRFQPHSE